MKKIVIMLMLFILTWPQLAAAAVPGKSGRVADLAGMFPANAVEKLGQQADKGPYAFYILTLDSLEGNEPNEYATQVYRDWKLSSNDVLLLIAKEERSVEMNYLNQTLDQALAALPADYDRNGQQEAPITEFLNRHFIPSAKEGDFARGVLSTMEAVRKLKVSGSQSGTAASGPSATTIAIAGAASVAIIGAIIAAQALMRGRNARRRLADQLARAERLMARIPRESDELKPFIGFLQGESEKLAAAAERQLGEQLVRLDQLNKEAAGKQIALYKVKELRTAEQQLKQAVDDIEARIDQSRQEIGRLQEADSTIKQRIGRLTELLEECRSRLDQAVSDTGFELGALRKSLKELEAERNELDKLRVFDPIAACEEVADSKSDSGKLLEDIRNIRPYEEGYRKFPEEAAALRQKLDALAHEHGVHLALSRLRPDKLIDQAGQLNEELMIHLREGEIQKTALLGEQRQTLLNKALEITVRQGELKRLTKENIGYIQSKQKAYEQDMYHILELFSAAKLKYSVNHWQELEEQYQRMIVIVKEIPQRVTSAARLCEDDEQQYDAAHERLEQLLTDVRNADELTARCVSTLSELDARTDSAKRMSASAWEQFQRSEARIRQENIPYHPEWTTISGDIHNLYDQCQRMSAAGKINLDKLEQAVQQQSQKVEGFVEAVNQAAYWKAQTEDSFADAHAKYEAVSRRSGNRINLSHYNKRYTELRTASEHLYNEGSYKEAMERIAAVRAIIQGMESDYQTAIAMERMAAEQRRRARSGGGGSWGSGGSGGSGGSSGGSSWGGKGGNSSGGSSWGGGKNSSGGSKW
ncbi:septation ring formation regulator EzrA [Paenibacillus sp. GCM10012307]|uniref:TPM domain-containing protein n=1 Tax=Paenibacillus roseus TaxID=2798579 RepID=A0A934JC04_9BACL|nr:septation ring formation regulator EzrA [Paenibacillus roseus]MBJ6364282.1 TPM domain-containing protein [Paenibacillus roseus]